MKNPEVRATPAVRLPVRQELGSRKQFLNYETSARATCRVPAKHAGRLI